MRTMDILRMPSESRYSAFDMQTLDLNSRMYGKDGFRGANPLCCVLHFYIHHDEIRVDVAANLLRFDSCRCICDHIERRITVDDAIWFLLKMLSFLS